MLGIKLDLVKIFDELNGQHRFLNGRGPVNRFLPFLERNGRIR